MFRLNQTKLLGDIISVPQEKPELIYCEPIEEIIIMEIPIPLQYWGFWEDENKN